jgi:hypothetical protein
MDEHEQVFEVGCVGQDLAGHRLGDVGDGEIKMPLGVDPNRPLDLRAGAQQRDE